MGKRITIVMDDSIHRKVRLEQSRLLKNSTKSVSFSSVVNDLLGKSLK
ncbi:MAG: hypothetical protein J4F36_13190 [Nitrosopumilaceae archaeon]|nr:hypothetical protein [Nitrosopumilaceae archaeon]